jgi:hypothetical protein
MPRYSSYSTLKPKAMQRLAMRMLAARAGNEPGSLAERVQATRFNQVDTVHVAPVQSSSLPSIPVWSMPT